MIGRILHSRTAGTVGLACAAVLMAGCTDVGRDQIARNAAKSAVRPVIAERFPGVPLEPSVNCIIDNATADEILALASDTFTGPTEATFETVIRIAARPGTVSCLTTQGLAALLT